MNLNVIHKTPIPRKDVSGIATPETHIYSVHAAANAQENKKRLIRASPVGRVGFEPTRAMLGGFSYHYSFRYQFLFVVWTIPSPYHVCDVGVPCLVSAPSAFAAWLRIAITMTC